jgi:hypothetical protein
MLSGAAAPSRAKAGKREKKKGRFGGGGVLW